MGFVGFNVRIVLDFVGFSCGGRRASKRVCKILTARCTSQFAEMKSSYRRLVKGKKRSIANNERKFVRKAYIFRLYCSNDFIETIQPEADR